MTRRNSVGVFIDASNLNLCSYATYNYPPDYTKLLEASLRPGDALFCATAYAANMGDGMDEWVEAIERCGFEVCRKEPDHHPDGSRKADWDVGLAVDIFRVLANLDVIVLGSGDGDFIPLVDLAHERGKKVRLLSVARRTHRNLRTVVDEVIPITEAMLYKPRAGKRYSQRRVYDADGFKEAEFLIRGKLRKRRASGRSPTISA